MKERIGNLLKAINRGLYEKETETALSGGCRYQFSKT